MNRTVLLLSYFGLVLNSLPAQQADYYRIAIGNFIDPRPEEFAAIQPLGFIYAEPLGNYTQVFMGGYTNPAGAQAKLEEIRSRGYRSAYLQERFTDEGTTMTLIQISTLSANKDIDWKKYVAAGNIFVIIRDELVKLAVGPFANVEAAREPLKQIRATGFKDAFIKNVNSIFVHRVTPFETGNGVQELFSLNLQEENAPPPASPQDATLPQSFDTRSGTTLSLQKSNRPAIRNNIKRPSVIEFQKLLKDAGVYQDAIDGLYGPTTAQAYDDLRERHRQIQQSLALAKSSTAPDAIGADALQQAINELPKKAEAITVINTTNHPVALAYRAYDQFYKKGPQPEVNQLMSQALRQSFPQGLPKNFPPFDPTASYAYNSLDQLILHLHYIHSAPENTYSAPCWLFERHPQETQRAEAKFANYSNALFNRQSCDSFNEWEEIQLLSGAARTLNPASSIDAKARAKANARRAQLTLKGQPLSPEEKKSVESWTEKIMNELDKWGNADPLHKPYVRALKIGYYQSQIRLEDYFMDQGLPLKEATPLAQATLKTFIENHLKRFN